jgi:hypothetical protein
MSMGTMMSCARAAPAAAASSAIAAIDASIHRRGSQCMDIVMRDMGEAPNPIAYCRKWFPKS